MEEALAQIVTASDSQEVKLRKIYDRVQQIRNKSYEVRKTEEEIKREKEKPLDNVEEFWKKGYGNGVQLTWLFLALARAAGFEAYGCWVSARNKYFFSPVTMQGSEVELQCCARQVEWKGLVFRSRRSFHALRVGGMAGNRGSGITAG